MPKTVAVVGASSSRAKFGNKALRAFVAQGYRVLPINPNESEVEGLKTKAQERETRSNAGTKSFQFPGSTPQTGGDEQVQYLSLGHQFSDNAEFKSWIDGLRGPDGKVSERADIRSPMVRTETTLTPIFSQPWGRSYVHPFRICR